MPLTVHTIEDHRHYDTHIFLGERFDHHAWAEIPADLDVRRIPLDLLQYDYTDGKLGLFGRVISQILNHPKALALVQVHPQILNHPIYQALKDNIYHQTSRLAQIPSEFLKFLGSLEIPLVGSLFENAYSGWVFPAEGPDSISRDLELKIALAVLCEDDPSLRSESYPFVLELTERSRGNEYIDRYLITIEGRQLFHSFVHNEGGKITTGRDRTFGKLGHCTEPLAVMVAPTLPSPLEGIEFVYRLRNRKLHELTESHKQRIAA